MARNDRDERDGGRELQNSQNSSPGNRQAYRPASGGRLASEASAIPDGIR